MQLTIGITAMRDEALAQLREPSAKESEAQRECEDLIREALADYLEKAAGPGGVGVTASINCSYNPA